MRLKFAAFVACAALFGMPAFGSGLCTGQVPNSDVGPTLTANGVTATGWQGTSSTSVNSSTDLFCKDGGAGETGLGIASDINGEIGTTNFIQLAGLSGTATLTIESVQAGEGFDIFGSNSNGVLGTALLASGTGGDTDTLTVSFDTTYIDITASSGNVLVDTSTSSATPEPGTYLLLGTGLLMLGFVARRKFASVSC